VSTYSGKNRENVPLVALIFGGLCPSAITWSRFCHARLRPGRLLIAACAVRQTAHQETVRRSLGLSLHPPIEPIHHFLLSRERKLVGAVKNKRAEPLRLADGLI